MNTLLYKIAKSILNTKPEGVSKVRLAKSIYFVHKELIRADFVRNEDLAYIRMPLGPVPDGLMTLTSSSDFKLEKRSTGLLYDAQIYKLKKQYDSNDEFDRTIESILKSLDKFYTTELVEISHKEPSWKNHSNSEKYFISRGDLKNKLPIKLKKKKEVTQEIAEQKMQAYLISGMIDDIVDESTGLEYPDDGTN